MTKASLNAPKRDSYVGERILSALLTGSAVVIALALAHREFLVAREPKQRSDERAPSFVSDWQTLASTGLLIGDPQAPVTVIEFGDLECPFCRQFHSTLKSARQRFGKNLRFAFLHYPLRSHRFARQAAHAAECAAAQGRFESFLDVAYVKQDSLGLRRWTLYAHESDVADTSRFASCMKDVVVGHRIDKGIALGDKLGVIGTPTIIINGWKFMFPPSDSQFFRVISDLAEGRQPFRRPPREGPRS